MAVDKYYSANAQSFLEKHAKLLTSLASPPTSCVAKRRPPLHPRLTVAACPVLTSHLQYTSNHFFLTRKFGTPLVGLELGANNYRPSWMRRSTPIPAAARTLVSATRPMPLRSARILREASLTLMNTRRLAASEWQSLLFAFFAQQRLSNLL